MATAAHPPAAPRAQAPRPRRRPPGLGDRGPLGSSPRRGPSRPAAAPDGAPGARVPARLRGAGPGTCARPYWIRRPGPGSARGRRPGRRAEPGSAPTRAGPGAEAARGELRQDAREDGHVPRLAALASAGLGALPPSLPPRHTTPRSHPAGSPAGGSLVARAPPAGGRAAIPDAQAAAGQPPWGRRAGREAGRWSGVLT